MVKLGVKPQKKPIQKIGSPKVGLKPIQKIGVKPVKVPYGFKGNSGINFNLPSYGSVTQSPGQQLLQIGSGGGGFNQQNPFVTGVDITGHSDPSYGITNLVKGVNSIVEFISSGKNWLTIGGIAVGILLVLLTVNAIVQSEGKAAINSALQSQGFSGNIGTRSKRKRK